MTLKPTQENHSRGRVTNGSPTWGVFTSPTPNAANTGAKLEYATKPTFTVGAGFYGSSQTVAIMSPDAGVAIHYTTDGSNANYSFAIVFTHP